MEQNIYIINTIEAKKEKYVWKNRRTTKKIKQQQNTEHSVQERNNSNRYENDHQWSQSDLMEDVEWPEKKQQHTNTHTEQSANNDIMMS